MYKKIIIVGGGTAGWMAANILARRWRDRSVDILLVESSEIGTIGVGEGSTPQLKSFFDYMGISELDWMPECAATYKTGIKFKGWSTKVGFTDYFHPFPSQPDDYTAPAFFYNSFLRRKGIDLAAHPDEFFLASYLAEHQLAPIAAYEFPFKVGYGYHFDSGLLGKFLRKHALQLGVRHLDARVQEVKVGENGYIKQLVMQDQQTCEADLFIDCTGFSGLLIQQTLKVPFISFAKNLFNDSAVVMPSPQGKSLHPQTVSTALSHGWMWNIPLTSRIGNGYVYSSDFCSPDAAESELRRQLHLQDADVEARHLKMKVGRVEQHWSKNCLAVGLSQGFIEPLEATALHLVQETILAFAEAYEQGGNSEQQQGNFNAVINRRFEAVRDYIVCHYRVNSRNDSDYWRANSTNNYLSESLRALLETWMAGENLTQEIERQAIGGYYPSASWHCLLAGYGIFPEQAQLRPGNQQAHKYNLRDIADFIRRCALNFPIHSQALKQLHGSMQAASALFPAREKAL